MRLKGSQIPDSHFKRSQLKKGIIVEREHTNKLSTRKAIAKAHLLENPNYYNNKMFKSDLRTNHKTHTIHHNKTKSTGMLSWIKKLDDKGKKLMRI